jgi:hypothetical protein
MGGKRHSPFDGYCHEAEWRRFRCGSEGNEALCGYPQVAKYKGTGDTNDAANFTCSPPN